MSRNSNSLYVNRPGFPEAVWFESCSHIEVLAGGIVICFGLCGRDVADGAEQAVSIEPVHPFEGGVFDGVERSPRATPGGHMINVDGAWETFSTRDGIHDVAFTTLAVPTSCQTSAVSFDSGPRIGQEPECPSVLYQ